MHKNETISFILPKIVQIQPFNFPFKIKNKEEYQKKC